MTGLDVLPHMLEHARDKAKELPIQGGCEDIPQFHLEKQYSLIFTYGAAFQYLFNRSDQEAMLGWLM